MPTLIIEDGTLVPDANSYISVAEADSYWVDHGSPVQWTGLTEDEKEVALIQATEYLETNYCFRSCLQSTTQSLSFPRLAFYDKEGRLLAGEGVIPKQIKNAQAELALRVVIDNSARLDTSPSDSNIIEEKVGDHEITFSEPNSQSYNLYPYVQKLLRNFILSSLNSVRIIRG